ncbi:MAG: GAF domain-containing protein [Nitrospinae bacterium]|nr:GAF domain-containing protein [Nitrospinota bacterium]
MYEEARRAQEEQRRVAREEASLAEIGRIIGSSLSLEDVYLALLRQVSQLIPADAITIVTIDQEEGTFNVAYSAGVDKPRRGRGETFPLAGSLTETVVSTGSASVVHFETRAQVERRHPGMLPGYDAGARSFLCVPVKARDQITGALHFCANQPDVYNGGQVALAERIGFLIGPAIENARLYEEARRTQEEQRRVYPHGRLAAHVLGFVDIDNNGLAAFPAVRGQRGGQFIAHHALTVIGNDYRRGVSGAFPDSFQHSSAKLPHHHIAFFPVASQHLLVARHHPQFNRRGPVGIGQHTGGFGADTGPHRRRERVQHHGYGGVWNRDDGSGDHDVRTAEHKAGDSARASGGEIGF